MDLNPFRICSPLKSLGCSMIIVVLGIIEVSYDAVAVVTLGPHLLDGGAMTLLSVVLLTLFHALLVLLSWNYFTVLLKDPGSVPANWKMSPQQNVQDGDSVISSISVVIPNSATMTSSQGSERKPTGYCDRCQNGKPPRCHHCSANDAFLKWVIIAYGLSTVSGSKLQILSSFCGYIDAVLNLAFVLILLCFVIMHASLMISNITSVEVHEKQKGVRWKYDLGWRKNIEQVFGTRKVFWPFPLFSKEDLERVPALHGIEA